MRNMRAESKEGEMKVRYFFPRHRMSLDNDQDATILSLRKEEERGRRKGTAVNVKNKDGSQVCLAPFPFP